MRLDGQSKKLLLAGGDLVGQDFVVSTFRNDLHSTWLCGSESQLIALHGSAPDTLLQIADAGEPVVFALESDAGTFRRIILDFEGLLGDFAMDARKAVSLTPQKVALDLDQPDKSLPLQSQIERELVEAMSRYQRRIMLFKDGSFKMEENA